MRAGKFVFVGTAAAIVVALSTPAIAAAEAENTKTTETTEKSEDTAEKDDEAPAAKAADVRVVIEQTDGVKVEISRDALTLGTDAELIASHEGTEHKVSMRVDAKDGDKLQLEVGYSRGGAKVIEAQSVETTGSTPTELSGPDVKLSVVVSPKKPRARIELPPGSDDPLAGL